HKHGGFLGGLGFDPAPWLLQMKFSPALAAAILIVGFAGGVGATYKLYGPHATIAGIPATTTQAPTPTEASIAGISSIIQDPNSNQISIKYNTVATQEAQGSLNDEKIQQL